MQVAFYLAGEITQVIDSMPWVRCASGNVFAVCLSFSLQHSAERKEGIGPILSDVYRHKDSSSGK